MMPREEKNPDDALEEADALEDADPDWALPALMMKFLYDSFCSSDRD